MNKDVQQIRAATERLATDSVDAVRKTANDIVDDGRTKAHDVAQIVLSKMQQQPVKSVLLATAIGFALGIFWRRG